MTILEDLRALILADANVAAVIGDRCHALHVPQGYQGPYVYIGQRTSNVDDDRAFDDPVGSRYHFSESFDVEAISEELSESTSLARLLMAALDNFAGTMGAGSCQVMFMRDHAEDYVPNGIGGDDGRSFAAYDLEILGYEEGT